MEVATDAGKSYITITRWIKDGFPKTGKKLKSTKQGARTVYIDPEEWHMFADNHGIHRKSKGIK